jgi:hypothetical protein
MAGPEGPSGYARFYDEGLGIQFIEGGVDLIRGEVVRPDRLRDGDAAFGEPAQIGFVGVPFQDRGGVEQPNASEAPRLAGAQPQAGIPMVAPDNQGKNQRSFSQARGVRHVICPGGGADLQSTLSQNRRQSIEHLRPLIGESSVGGVGREDDNLGHRR